MEMIIRYPALPEGMTQKDLEFQLADTLDDGGWLLGAGADAEGNWLDVELEDEKNNPKHAILAVKAYFQSAEFDPKTTIELAGKPVGIYE